MSKLHEQYDQSCHSDCRMTQRHAYIETHTHNWICRAYICNVCVHMRVFVSLGTPTQSVSTPVVVKVYPWPLPSGSTSTTDLSMTFRFNISLPSPPTGCSYSQSPYTWNVGTSIASVIPSSCINNPTSYTLSTNDLSTLSSHGLSFSSTNGTFSGIPTRVTTQVIYIYFIMKCICAFIITMITFAFISRS